jgi:subtilisin family serine protease
MMNVTGLWKEGVTGKGVISALIDDGLDYESDDLKANFVSLLFGRPIPDPQRICSMQQAPTISTTTNLSQSRNWMTIDTEQDVPARLRRLRTMPVVSG